MSLCKSLFFNSMGDFSRLPTEIVLEILTRLPTELVLECKLVCKPWRNLVSRHPSFSKLHLTRFNRSADSSKLSFIVLSLKHFYYFEFDENNVETPIDSMRRINFAPPFATPGYTFFGSINGLVCLSGYHDKSVCICNPVTKEYVKLPKFSRDSDSDQYCPWVKGFGYLPLTNEYKFVESMRLKTNLSIVEVAVYTIGSGTGWRNVGRFDLKCGDTLIEDGVFVNGVLYWVNKTGGVVFVFDLTEEKFLEHISPPPKPPGWWHGYSIGVLDGALYYAIEHGYDSLEESTSDIWLLKGRNNSHDTKEQVEEETLGWSFEFSFPEKKPFALVKGGGVLYFGLWSLGIYDAVTSTSKGLVHFSTVNQIYHHMNTLVSLKELGEEDVKILDSARFIEDRKPFFPTKDLVR